MRSWLKYNFDDCPGLIFSGLRECDKHGRNAVLIADEQEDYSKKKSI